MITRRTKKAQGKGGFDDNIDQELDRKLGGDNIVIILTMILTKKRRRMLNDDIVGEETRNDRRKHKPRVTGGSQWESGATAVPLFRFILILHEMCFQFHFVLSVFAPEVKKGRR